jgi:hypothetical protein
LDQNEFNRIFIRHRSEIPVDNKATCSDNPILHRKRDGIVAKFTGNRTKDGQHFVDLLLERGAAPMEIFEKELPEKKNEVYRACLNIVLEVFAVLIGVGIHHFFTKGQDDWGLILGYTGWIFWGAFVALLCSALSYFIGGGLYLHATYLAHPEKPHEYWFLLAIASRVIFGVLLLWAAKSPDFGNFLHRLLIFEAVGFFWSLLHLGIAKRYAPRQKKGAKLAMLWLWTDLVAALFLFALLRALNSFGPGVLLAILLIVGSVLLFAYDFIKMIRISLDE